MANRELSDADLKLIFSTNPRWLLGYNPEWVVDNEPDWMLSDTSGRKWMIANRPTLVFSMNPTIMFNDNIIWVADNEPKVVAKDKPKWLLAKRPHIMAEHNPKYMVEHAPEELFDNRPEYMVEHAYRWVLTNRASYLDTYGDNTKDIPDFILELLSSKEEEVASKVSMLWPVSEQWTDSLDAEAFVAMFIGCELYDVSDNGFLRVNSSVVGIICVRYGDTLVQTKDGKLHVDKAEPEEEKVEEDSVQCPVTERWCRSREAEAFVACFVGCKARGVDTEGLLRVSARSGIHKLHYGDTLVQTKDGKLYVDKAPEEKKVEEGSVHRDEKWTKQWVTAEDFVARFTGCSVHSESDGLLQVIAKAEDIGIGVIYTLRYGDRLVQTKDGKLKVNIDGRFVAVEEPILPKEEVKETLVANIVRWRSHTDSSIDFIDKFSKCTVASQIHDKLTIRGPVCEYEYTVRGGDYLIQGELGNLAVLSPELHDAVYKHYFVEPVPVGKPIPVGKAAPEEEKVEEVTECKSVIRQWNLHQGNAHVFAEQFDNCSLKLVQEDGSIQVTDDAWDTYVVPYDDYLVQTPDGDLSVVSCSMYKALTGTLTALHEGGYSLQAASSINIVRWCPDTDTPETFTKRFNIRGYTLKGSVLFITGVKGNRALTLYAGDYLVQDASSELVILKSHVYDMLYGAQELIAKRFPNVNVVRWCPDTDTPEEFVKRFNVISHQSVGEVLYITGVRSNEVFTLLAGDYLVQTISTNDLVVLKSRTYELLYGDE